MRCNWFSEDGSDRVKVGIMSENTCPKCGSSTYNIPVDKDELEKRGKS